MKTTKEDPIILMAVSHDVSRRDGSEFYKIVGTDGGGICYTYINTTHKNYKHWKPIIDHMLESNVMYWVDNLQSNNRKKNAHGSNAANDYNLLMGDGKPGIIQWVEVDKMFEMFDLDSIIDPIEEETPYDTLFE